MILSDLTKLFLFLIYFNCECVPNIFFIRGYAQFSISHVMKHKMD